MRERAIEACVSVVAGAGRQPGPGRTSSADNLPAWDLPSIVRLGSGRVMKTRTESCDLEWEVILDWECEDHVALHLSQSPLLIVSAPDWTVTRG